MSIAAEDDRAVSYIYSAVKDQQDVTSCSKH